MKKALTAVWIFFRSSFQLSYFAAALVTIFLISYFLGYSYLQGLYGNDTFYHLSGIYWISKFFPNVPYWFPLQNGGVVPAWGYPQLSYFIVVMLSRLFGLSLVGAYQVFGLLSIPLTALGLYLFVWTRLKNQTIAWIGAIFYVLSPISWTWLFDWGFYTESVSYIFIFPALIFYDVFLVSYLEGKMGIFARISFFLAVLFLSINFLMHPTTFFITLAIAAALTVFQVLDKQRRPVLDTLKKIATPFILFSVLSLSLVSFLLLDFYNYSSDSVGTSAHLPKQEEFVRDYNTPVGSLLGLEKIPPTEFKYGHRNLVVPFAVWIPAIAGFLLAIVFSRKVLALSVLAFLPVLLFQWPIIAWYIAKYIPMSYQFIHHRAVLLFMRVLIPIVGAFGLYGLFKFIFLLPTFWVKKGKLKVLRNISIAFLASVLSLSAAVLLIIYFADKPDNLWRKTDVRYGPKVFDIRDPFPQKTTFDSCDALQPDDPGRPKACNLSFVRQNLDVSPFLTACSDKGGDVPEACAQIAKGEITESQFGSFLQSCKNDMGSKFCRFLRVPDLIGFEKYLQNSNNWPRPKLEDRFNSPFNQFSGFIAAHKGDKLLRIDVSPYLGGIVQTLSLESDISQINLYAVTLSKLGPYWGYEQQVMFSKSMGDTVNVNNLAKWFGTKYLFMSETLDPVEKYKNDPENWKMVDKDGAWEFAKAPKMYSWTINKPAVLVIGSQEKRAFEPLFRISVSGGFPYDNGWLVQGKENIDDYSLEELKKFDALILFGYSYKDQGNAFKLLDQYIKEGGKVFLDTGWQYTDRDWQIEKAPDFFPVKDLVWSTSHTTASKYRLENSDISKEVDVAKFSPLKWADQSWGVSVPKSGVRDWGKVILASDNDPLVVLGNYGKGKIVWSGVNWMGHISTYDFNREEIKFYLQVFNQLLGSQIEDESIQSGKVTVQRDNPDRVEFKFQDQTGGPSTLYWRETEFPNWKATLVDSKGAGQSVKIYRAGPGFMLMRLPNLADGSKLILEFDSGARTFIGVIISALTMTGLLLYVILGYKFTHLFATFIARGKGKIQNRISGWWEKSDEEDKY